MPQHRISAGALVEHEHRLLMVHHVRPGRYDFWVAPGGGVEGHESLADAAAREVREECGLDVTPGRLLYIEELHHPGLRMVKFWFTATLRGDGSLSVASPKAAEEFITEAAWLTQDALRARSVYPPALSERYWKDRERDSDAPVLLGLRPMEVW